MPITNDSRNRRPTHSEVLTLLERGGDNVEDLTLEYLDWVAVSFSSREVFAVMALVDTPDVFD